MFVNAKEGCVVFSTCTQYTWPNIYNCDPLIIAFDLYNTSHSLLYQGVMASSQLIYLFTHTT